MFAPDGIHPYAETGHQLYLEMIQRAMEAMRKNAAATAHALLPPYAADNWEAAKLLPVSRAKLSAGWRQLIPGQDPLATQFANRFPELWCARQPGATLTFRLKGTYAAVFGLLGPDNGQLLISLDDRPPQLKPNFDPWSNKFRPQYTVIGENLPNGDHTVTVTIAPDPADKAKILGRKIDDPEKYDGTAFYPGGIMIVGELVESP